VAGAFSARKSCDDDGDHKYGSTQPMTMMPGEDIAAAPATWPSSDTAASAHHPRCVTCNAPRSQPASRGGHKSAAASSSSSRRALLAAALAALATQPSCSQRALDGTFVPDLLQPLYEWNVNQHTSNHYLSSVRHDTLTSTGAVVIQNGVAAASDGVFGRELVSGLLRVRTLDSPKEPCQRVCTPEGVCSSVCEGLPGRAPLRDVLTAKPTAERPAIAEISVPLTSANFGHNRIHAFAHASALACVEVERRNATANATYMDQDCTPPYDDVSGVISAVLAPLSSSHSVLREVELRPLSVVGEWQEILGDFYLLPSELGSGAHAITLFVRLGSPLATVGSVC
jgi:hypothetical protein